MILKMPQESLVLISFHVFGANFSLIFLSSFGVIFAYLNFHQDSFFGNHRKIRIPFCVFFNVWVPFIVYTMVFVYRELLKLIFCFDISIKTAKIVLL